MNERIRFTIIVSSPRFPYQDALAWLGPNLSQHFAGACFQQIDGIWAADGEHDKPLYQIGQNEKGMKIVLSVMPKQQDAAEQKIQQMLQVLKDELDLPISWVHMEIETVTAKHFKLI